MATKKIIKKSKSDDKLSESDLQNLIQAIKEVKEDKDICDYIDKGFGSFVSFLARTVVIVGAIALLFSVARDCILAIIGA